MSLIHDRITPIPDDEPEAIPSLWNSRYREIDENFESLDHATRSIFSEIEEARAGNESLGKTIKNIVSQIGGNSNSLSGTASSASVQKAVELDWLYRDRPIFFELFTPGYNLQSHSGVAVISGVMGDDSLDIASTSGVKIGSDYLLSDQFGSFLVRISAVLSETRIRLNVSLTRNFGSNATLTGCSFKKNPDGGVFAEIGEQWVSKQINLGDDNISRSVIIRRSLNAGELRLFFRDEFTTSWTEKSWSVRRQGDAANGIPDGFADYEYSVPLRGNGYIRLETDIEDVSIKHIVALGRGTDQGGYVNPLLRPNAPAVSSPATGATSVTETPTLSASSYFSPAGNSFFSAQFQISLSSTFATILHDSGERQAMTYSIPSGVLAVNTKFYVRVKVKDIAGLISDWSTISNFTTKSTYAYVTTPSVISPINGQSEIPEQPTFQSSPFAVTGGTDTQASSQWQIRLATGTWASPLHDSGASTTSKTSYTVPPGVLVSGQTQYVMRVRYIGTGLGASEWSSDIAFTTKNVFASIIGIVCSATGGGAGTWQRINENFSAINTTSATFNNNPVYAGIVAQTIDSQAMIKIPKFYVKTGAIPSGVYAGKRYWMISDQPVPGFSVHPAFMNGGAQIDQFWVGKYQGTDAEATKLGSAPNRTPLVSVSFSTIKSYANNRNVGGITGFDIWNIHQLSAIQTLMLIEMGGSDGQSLIGQGVVNSSAMEITNSSNQVNWRGIVGLWGNIWQYVDGIKTDSETGKYSIYDKNGNKTYTLTGISPPAAGFPVTLATAASTNFDLSLAFVPETTYTTITNGTFPDYFYQYGDKCAFFGHNCASGQYAGAFSLCFVAATTETRSDAGSRLSKI